MSKWTTKEKISITLFIVGVLIGLPVALWYVWIMIFEPDIANSVGKWFGQILFASTSISLLGSMLSGSTIRKLLRKHKKPS